MCVLTEECYSCVTFLKFRGQLLPRFVKMGLKKASLHGAGREKGGGRMLFLFRMLWHAGVTWRAYLKRKRNNQKQKKEQSRKGSIS